MWAFILFNAFGAAFFYWLARVPKNKEKEQETAEMVVVVEKKQ
jgi:hypothetical protein